MDSHVEEQNINSHVEEQDIDSDTEEQSLAPFPRQVDWCNHNIWDWEAEDMETWEPASPAWQDFMNCWLDPIRAADLHHNVFPYELQIFPTSHFPMPESTITKIGAWPFLQTLNGKMLVLERHAFLYHSLNGVREERYRGGAVLGGQPGIGKSLLLWYFLVRLIQDRQPVVLHLPANASSTTLFYNGKAWCPKSVFNFQAMPHGPNHSKINRSRPIFVLVDSAETVPLGMAETMGWPIQVMSPKPGRSKEFVKKREPLIWGLDLWTPDQLLDGLKLQLEWPLFVEDLSTLLQGGTANTKALRCVVSLASEPRYKDWPKTTVEEWTRILLDNAVYWRGWTARDVFGIILHPKGTEFRIEGAIAFNPLQDVVSLLTRMDLPAYYSFDPFPHKPLALQMQPQSLTSDDDSMFTFVIKSPAIQAVMDDDISRNDDSIICHIFNRLRALPSGGGSVLAEHIFAEYALGRMTVANPALPLKPMDFLSGTVAHPTFTADKNAWSNVPKGVYPHSYARPSLEYMPTKGMKRCAWQEPNYKCGPLKAGVFYVPIATNHPLFDAFFLENTDSHSVLWILQFTTTSEHEGAGKGLTNVRRLLNLAKRTIEKVHVRWVLVTPTSASDDGVSDWEWQMPPAWNKSIIQNDPRSYLWLQEIDMNSGR